MGGFHSNANRAHKESFYNPEKPEKVGPWGSQAGTFWSYIPNRPIQKIIVRYTSGGNFHSIIFESWNEKEGVVETTGRYGSTGGQTDAVIQLDWPNEYLTGISGNCYTSDGKYCIETLFFMTNRNKYGPYGSPSSNATPFQFSLLPNQIIVGFFGRFGVSGYLDAIGVYIKSIADVFGPSIETITPTVGSS